MQRNLITLVGRWASMPETSEIVQINNFAYDGKTIVPVVLNLNLQKFEISAICLEEILKEGRLLTDSPPAGIEPGRTLPFHIGLLKEEPSWENKIHEARIISVRAVRTPHGWDSYEMSLNIQNQIFQTQKLFLLWKKEDLGQ